MQQAKRIKAFRSNINFVNAGGLVTEIGVPELTRKMEEYRAGDMSAPVDIDQGLEKMTGYIVIEGADTQLVKSMGVCLNESPHVRTFASAEGEDCETDSHEHIFQGRIFKETRDPFKSGDKSTVKYEFTLHRYSWLVNNVEHIHIEPMECVERYMGVDRLEARRKALGME